MTAVRAALRQLEQIDNQLLQLEKRSDQMDAWREVFKQLASAIEQLEAIPGICLECGQEHGRSAEYCSDRCRALHYRTHMPLGTVRSARRLVNNKASIVIHYGPEEAERALTFKLKQPVYLAPKEAT